MSGFLSRDRRSEARSEPIRISIFHESHLLRDCLAHVLAEQEDFSAAPGEGWDVALVDIDLPDDGALRITADLVRDQSEVKVILLGTVKSEDRFLSYIEAGALGYIPKEARIEELFACIRRVVQGEALCPPNLAQAAFSRLAELSQEQDQLRGLENLPLTQRELVILRLISEGLSNKDIAQRLCVSTCTVKNHVHNLLAKLKVQHRFQAVLYAQRMHWLERGSA